MDPRRRKVSLATAGPDALRRQPECGLAKGETDNLKTGQPKPPMCNAVDARRAKGDRQKKVQSR